MKKQLTIAGVTVLLVTGILTADSKEIAVDDIIPEAGLPVSIKGDTHTISFSSVRDCETTVSNLSTKITAKSLTVNDAKAIVIFTKEKCSKASTDLSVETKEDAKELIHGNNEVYYGWKDYKEKQQLRINKK